MRNSGRIAFGGVVFTAALLCMVLSFAQESRDRAGWGSDHVGKAMPMYMTGDECLFCHREKVGATLQTEPHTLTMRAVQGVSPTLQALLGSEAARGFAGDATWVLGGDRQRRFLKANGKYGQMAIHSAKWDVRAELLSDADGGWDDDRFAQRCAGCHATAVETEYAGFSAQSLDCFVCHGDTPQGHQNEPELALFAKKRTPNALVEISTCAQCHLRGGASRSTGLPYPNQFVAGDNLFRDFEVELSDEHLATLNPGDRHVFEIVRDVVMDGRLEMTCTTCHSIHGQSTRKHRVLKRLEGDAYCASCHDDLEDYTSLVRYESHSALCEY